MLIQISAIGQTLMPNPANKMTTVSLNVNKKSDDTRVELIDGTGKILEVASSITSNNVELKTADLPNGVYVIKVIYGDKHHEGNVVVQH